MDKTLKWAMILGIGVVSTSVAYYFVWFQPQTVRLAQAVSRQERITNCEEKVDSKWAPQMKKAVDSQYATPDAESFKTVVDYVSSHWKSEKDQCSNIL